jgi:hypothetical protein
MGHKTREGIDRICARLFNCKCNEAKGNFVNSFMKQPFYILIAFAMFSSACKKDNKTTDLTGSWRLIEVYDKNTRTTSYPPTGSNSDVVIHFSGNNRFSGHTLRNTFNEGSYTITGNNKISFGAFSTTQVGEDSWGGNFYTVLSACYLQSVTPCNPSDFSIQGNILKIETPLRYNITLKRL